MKQMDKDVIICNAIGSFFVFFGVLRDDKILEDGQMAYRINFWNPLSWATLFVILVPIFTLTGFYEGFPVAIEETKQFLKDVTAQK